MEKRLLRNQTKSRVQLKDADCMTLAEIGKKLGKQALAMDVLVANAGEQYWPHESG